MVQTHFAGQNSARNAVGKIQTNESKRRHFTNGNALQTAILTGIRRFFCAKWNFSAWVLGAFGAINLCDFAGKKKVFRLNYFECQ